MTYEIEDADPFDITKLAATEITDLCLNLYEQLGRAKDKQLKRELKQKYNFAANYYNKEVAKFHCLQTY